jgi:Asp/Glu/hydantoin racemase
MERSAVNVFAIFSKTGVDALRNSFTIPDIGWPEESLIEANRLCKWGSRVTVMRGFEVAM